MLGGGIPVPVIPRHLRRRLIAASGGVAVTTDPESGSPYLCKSFWDDEDAEGNVALIEALQTRTDHYLLYGVKPSGFHCYLAMVARSGDTAVLAKCTRWERRASFAAACHDLLADQWAAEPVSELRRWIWVSDEPRLAIAIRSDSGENDREFGYLHPRGWRGQRVESTDAALTLVSKALEDGTLPEYFESFITRVLVEPERTGHSD